MQGLHSEHATEGELAGGLPRKRLAPGRIRGRGHSTRTWSSPAACCLATQSCSEHAWQSQQVGGGGQWA